jgi:hypothetical protein
MDYYASQRKRALIVLCSIMVISIVAFGIPLIVFAVQGSTSSIQAMAVPLILIVITVSLFMIIVLCSKRGGGDAPPPHVDCASTSHLGGLGGDRHANVCATSTNDACIYLCNAIDTAHNYRDGDPKGSTAEPTNQHIHLKKQFLALNLNHNVGIEFKSQLFPNTPSLVVFFCCVQKNA